MIGFALVGIAVNGLAVDENYEKKALSLYTAFLRKFPQSPYAKQINEAIA